nr:heat shock factor protein 3-like isoform X1 [Zootoca vivipara]
MKLWAILEDSRNDSMITWSPDGQKVCILDDQRFAYQLLPKYFKHCNLSSFVRQLYSYGFKKVMSIKNGTMVAVNNSPMEFQHPYFIQRKPELLVNIQRKVPTPKEPAAGSIDLQAMLSEFRAVREHQNNISLKLDTMARDSTYLIKRMASLQKKDNQQQQHVLSQILQIIVNWMSEKGRLDAERKRSQNDASEAPRPKNSRPQARSAMEGRETAAVPGHSADRKDLIVTPKIEGEAGGAAGTSNGQAVVHERRGTRKELQAFLNFFCSNTVEIGALLSEKFNSISEILTETFVPERQDLDVKFEGALDGSLKNVSGRGFFTYWQRDVRQ